MKYSELRPVLIYDGKVPGRFHQWATAIDPFSQKAITYGIVERQDGEAIELVRPTDIKFTDTATHKLVDSGMSQMDADLKVLMEKQFLTSETRKS